MAQPASSDVQRLTQTCDVPSIVAACMALRGIDTNSAEAWLSPSLDHLHDPMAMRGMAEATQRIEQAIAAKERIRIVTDYDVDGTTSSLILQGVLRLLGAGERIDYHIPDRQKEGYGFSEAAAKSAAHDGIGLIITADIGVRDHASVAAARAAGVDVVICDHHLPAGADVPPDATAVLCPPQHGCDYPNPHLAACGVSLKLAQAMLATHPRYEAIIRSMMKMAAIGTVADVVNLATLENRAIVHLGLEALAGPNTPGLQALLDVAQVSSPMTAQDLGFRVGPRINAAGRLAQATAVLELIHTRDPATARQRAQELDQLNQQRQRIQGKLVDQCIEQLPDPPPPFVVLWGEEAEGWHRGVVGIVAAKVRDRIHRPTAIVAVAGQEARGSVRSTTGVHAVHALDAAADLLDSHGGHPAAAGFSIAARHLPTLAERLAAHAKDIQGGGGHAPELQLDADCPVELLSAGGATQLAKTLARLEPFGKGNPPPMLRIPSVVPEQLSAMGKNHLRMRIAGVDAVWWGGLDKLEALQGPVSIAGTLGFNHWRGRSTVRFTVRDACHCVQPPAEELPPCP